MSSPGRRTLDGFVEAVSRAEGIGLTDVDALTTLVVRTDNSVYQITILQPYARGGRRPGWGVLPSKHAGLPERVQRRRQLSETRVDGVGLRLEFHAANQWIITSHVGAIAVEASATQRPC